MDFDAIDVSKNPTLSFEQKKALKKAHLTQFRPVEGSKKLNSNKSKFTKKTNTKFDATNGDHQEDNSNGSNGKPVENTESGLSITDQTFGRGGGIIIENDNNTNYYYTKIGNVVGGRSNGGRERVQG